MKRKRNSGKCSDCFILKWLLTHYGALTRDERAYGIALKAHHGLKCKLGRKAYQDNITKAMESGGRKQSWVLDGMSRKKTHVPWTGDLGCQPDVLDVHVEGAMRHGHEKNAFLDFPHQSTSSSNKLIEALVHLVDQSKDPETNLYPEEVCCQVDGGAENANKRTLAFITYLVAIGVYSRFVYNRSDTGHGHNDEDAFFALISAMLERTGSVQTLQAFTECIERCSPGKSAQKSWQNNIKVTPLYANGNYKEFFAGCTVEHPTHFQKGATTVHQWEFVRVPVSAAYPVGVATFYKHYPYDKVPLLTGAEGVGWQTRRANHLAGGHIDRTIEALDLELPQTQTQSQHQGKGKKNPLSAKEKQKEAFQKLGAKFEREHAALVAFRDLMDDGKRKRNDNKLNVMDIKRIWMDSPRHELAGGFLSSLPPQDRVLTVDDFTKDKTKAHAFAKARLAVELKFGVASEQAIAWEEASKNFPPPPPPPQQHQRKRKQKSIGGGGGDALEERVVEDQGTIHILALRE